MSSKTISSVSHRSLLLIILLAAVGLFAGWRLFWFLTDDAYIAFRYISNSQLGYGYTWNPPPFRAVEGYTSFLWVFLLDLVWRVTAIEPPDAANYVSLLFSFGTVLLGVGMLIKLPLNTRLEHLRLPIMLLVMAGILTNRTFLAWTSSGLETAMFNFFITAWVYVCLTGESYTPRWVFWITLAVVLAALTRPDGLLFIGATLLLIALTALSNYNDRKTLLHTFLATLPLMAIVIHLLWRRMKYGEWVPNTYAAKYIAPWPESGWRYLLSFIMEYSLWIWLGIALFFALRTMRKSGREAGYTFVGNLRTYGQPPYWFVSIIVIVTLLLHAAYYTFIIGGDHFEYRVYSHLITLIFISAVLMLNALDLSPNRVITLLALSVILSWPLQWTHWLSTHEMTTRAETEKLQVPIASYFPSFVQPYIQYFDQVQLWLISHNVANRHQEHKIFHEYQLSIYPSRATGRLLSAETYPVMVAEAVGVPSWMLPTTNIIDALGLNDYIVARYQTPDAQHRAMAHDRRLPAGYAECFRPNVRVIMGRKVVIKNRDLTATEIIDCENSHWNSGIADKNELRTLGINHTSARAVDEYLWAHGPPGNVFFFYDPIDTDSAQSNEELLKAFLEYEGLGCLIIPPADSLRARDDYLFAFFDAEHRPDSSEFSKDFPWMKSIEGNAQEQTDPIHIVYSATAGEELLPHIGHEHLARWANGISLIDYKVSASSFSDAATLYLTLIYHTSGSIENGQSSFVHLIGEMFNSNTGSPLWAQYDADPCRDYLPMELWPQEATVISKAAIELPHNVPAGEFELRTGFYKWQDGQRIRLTEGAGEDEGWKIPEIISVNTSPSSSQK